MAFAQVSRGFNGESVEAQPMATAEYDGFVLDEAPPSNDDSDSSTGEDPNGMDGERFVPWADD